MTNQPAGLTEDEVRRRLKAGEPLEGSFLHGLSLSGTSLRGANLRGASLNTVDLTRADLEGVDLRNATVTHTTLNGAHAGAARLSGTSFVDCRAAGGSLPAAELVDGAWF